MIQSPEKCQCAYCANNLPFHLDEYLIGEITSGNVVVFAGAGVSTENQNASPHTLYDSMVSAIGDHHRGLGFPDVVEILVDRSDGRFRFVKMVQDRFDYIEKFSDLRKAAQVFFKELSTIPCINEYVTTNWDRNFEEVCHAKPFVYDADLRFWDVPRRKVLKIHGTIDNYSTLVASRTDYDAAQAKLETGLIGAKLKTILATKTCIFVGYSLRDEDFAAIFDFVVKSQGAFSKAHYFVNPFHEYEGPHENLISIKTDGTHFFRIIKEHLSSSPCILPDSAFSEVSEELDAVISDHHRLWEERDPKKFPQALPSALYQDGLIHGYRMILDQAGSGRFSHSCEVLETVRGYDKIISEYKKKKKFLQVPYFRGYQNALMSIVVCAKMGDFLAPPRYFYNGIEEMNEDEFVESFGDLEQYHQSVFKQAKAKLAELGDEDLVIQMQPWLG